MSKFPRREVVEFWRCSWGHRHSNLSLAKRCEEITKRAAESKAVRDKRAARKEKHSLKRQKDAYDLHASGKTWKEIGRIVGRLDDPGEPIAALQAEHLAYQWNRELMRRQCRDRVRARARQ